MKILGYLIVGLALHVAAPRAIACDKNRDEYKRETPRFYDGDTLKAANTKINEASCGLASDGQFFAIKNGESIPKVGHYQWSRLFESRDCKWIKNLSPEGGYRVADDKSEEVKHKWSENAQELYVKPGCNLKIYENEGFKGTMELAVPPDNVISRWASGNEFTQLIKIDPKVQKTRLDNKIGSVICECNEKVVDPANVGSSSKTKAEADVAAHKVVFEREFAANYAPLKAAVQEHDARIAEWKEHYSNNNAAFNVGLIYADLNQTVDLKEMLKSHADLSVIYAKACPAFDYQLSLEKLRAATQVFKSFRNTARVFFAGYSNQLSYFSNHTNEATKTLISIEGRNNSFDQTLTDISNSCETWATAIESIPQRIRYEKNRAALIEYIELSEEITAAIEASTSALKRYDTKLLWTWSVQERIKLTRSALTALHYNEAKIAIDALREFWGQLAVEISESTLFDEAAKKAVETEFLARIQKVNTDWIELESNVKVKGMVLARVQNELNSKLFKKARISLSKHPEKVLKFAEFQSQLESAGFQLLEQCSELETSVSNKDCWTYAYDPSLSDAEYISLDEKMNALTNFLNSL